MTFELPTTLETELRTRAEKEGRDVRSVVEDAVRQYLEAAAITDLQPEDAAAAQTALAGELSDVSEWKDPPA